MLKNLLNSGLNSDSAEQRLAAIAKMDADSTSSQSSLQELVTQDTDAAVRRAALNKISDPLVIHKLSKLELGSETKSDTVAALRNLLGAKSVLNETGFESLLNAEPELKAIVLQVCPYEKVRQQLVAQFEVGELAELLAEMEYTDTRQLVAQQLDSEALLEQARNALKGRDKSAEKIIRSKLDDLHRQEREEQQKQSEAETICQKMEHLASHEWRPEFKAMYSVWLQRWQALDFSSDPQLVERFNQSSSSVAGIIATLAEQETALQASVAVVNALESYAHSLANLDIAQLKAQQEAILSIQSKAAEDRLIAVEQSALSVEDEDRFTQAQASLSSLVEFCQWWETEDQSEEPETSQAVTEAVVAVLEEAPIGSGEGETAEIPESEKGETKTQTASDTSKAITEVNADSLEKPENSKPLLDKHAIKALEQAKNGLSWPDSYPDLQALSEATAEIERHKSALQSSQKASSESLDKLHKRLNRLLSSAKVGKIALAKRELEAVKKAALKLPVKDRAQLDERLDKAAQEVSKIEDWKDFATEPKYVALCEKMEALIGSDTHADKLSEQISKHQAQWKSLGHSASADKHWERFKAAADKAYEPCAVFFAQRHEQREKNLQSREPFILELRTLLEKTNWDDTPDHKAIEQKLQSIQNSWQKIKDVEHKAGQKQWKRYRKVRQAIFKKLDVEYQANIGIKHQIIEQAEKLLAAQIADDSLEKLQAIQAKWKEVGVTRRGDDQKAWKKYKKTTDAVYEKIQSQRSEKRALEDEQIAAHRALVEQLFSLSKTAKDTALADKSYQQIKAEYAALPPLPKGFPEALALRVEGDFKRAKQFYAEALDRLNRNVKQQVFSALEEKAALCQQIEALFEAGDTAEAESLSLAYEESPLANKDFQKQLDKRFKQVQTKDRTKFSEQRRAMCIDLEILLGVESPKSDAGMRTKIQLERMQSKGFGHQVTQSTDKLKQMKLDWLCLPGADSAQQTELDQRFYKVLAKSVKPKSANSDSRSRNNKNRPKGGHSGRGRNDSRGKNNRR